MQSIYFLFSVVWATAQGRSVRGVRAALRSDLIDGVCCNLSDPVFIRQWNNCAFWPGSILSVHLGCPAPACPRVHDVVRIEVALEGAQDGHLFGAEVAFHPEAQELMG